MPLRRALKWSFRAVAVVTVVALAVFAFTAFRVWHVARRDDRAQVDAIVVLGASQYDGRPSEVFRARLDHAAVLFRADVAPRVVTVGGNRQGDRFTEAGSGAAYLRNAGVPADAVLDVPEGSDTVTSLRAAARLLHERAWTRVVLVTDPWHSYRSRAIAEDVGLEAATSPARTGPVVQTRAREVRYILRETAAYLYYQVFGSGPGRGPDAV